MAIAFVNTGNGTNDASGSTLATGATSLTTGNLIVALIAFTSATATVSSVTDTAGNTYVQYPSAFQRVNNTVTDVWYCENATGNASNVVTVHYSAAVTFRRLITHQYSGVATSGSAESAGAVGHIASNVTVTSGSLTTTGNTDVLVALGTNGTGTGTYSAGTNFTLRGSTIGTDTRSEDRIGVTAASYTGSITLSAAAEQWITVAAFKDNTGGGTVKDITLSVTGTSTPAFTVQKTAQVVLAVTGTSAPSFTVQKTAQIVLAVTGTSTPSFTVAGTKNIVLAVTGTSTPSFRVTVTRQVVLAVTGSSAPSFSVQRLQPTGSLPPTRMLMGVGQ